MYPGPVEVRTCRVLCFSVRGSHVSKFHRSMKPHNWTARGGAPEQIIATARHHTVVLSTQAEPRLVSPWVSNSKLAFKSGNAAGDIDSAATCRANGLSFLVS
jgi:hypothetical protein